MGRGPQPARPELSVLRDQAEEGLGGWVLSGTKMFVPLCFIGSGQGWLKPLNELGNICLDQLFPNFIRIVRCLAPFVGRVAGSGSREGRRDGQRGCCVHLNLREPGSGQRRQDEAQPGKPRRASARSGRSRAQRLGRAE